MLVVLCCVVLCCVVLCCAVLSCVVLCCVVLCCVVLCCVCASEPLTVICMHLGRFSGHLDPSLKDGDGEAWMRGTTQP